jgi:hypothetical protein
VLCTTLSWSSSASLTATLVRVRERYSASFEPRAYAPRILSRRLPRARRSMRTTSSTAGTARSVSHVVAWPVAVVRHAINSPTSGGLVC